MVLNITNFEKQIDSVILGRGKSYFIDGAVYDLEQVTANQWVARVEGTESYEVTITLKKDTIKDWECNCPYDWGPVCKHVVAVLYAIDRVRKEGPSLPVNTGKKKRKKKSKGEQLHEILQKVSKEELLSFIEDYALHHNRFLNDIFIRFIDLLEIEPESKYTIMIKSIVRSGKGRDGFIDYQTSFTVTRQIDEMLGKAEFYLEQGEHQESIANCKAVIEEIPKMIQVMDDSSGEAGCCFQKACEIFEKNIIDMGRSSLKNGLFNYCITEYPKSKYHNFGFESCFLHFLTYLADDENKEKEYLDLLDTLLHRFRQEGNNWKTVEILKHKIHLFGAIGKHKEARNIIEENLEYSDFRMILVDESIRKENFKKAEALSEEGLRIAKMENHWGDVRLWKEKLLDIAEKTRDIGKIRNWAEELFLSPNHEMKYYRRLKKTYVKKDWQEKVKEILASIKGGQGRIEYFKVHILCQIYVEEKYKDRLLNILQVNETALPLVDRFAPYLKKDYPEAVLDLYRKSVDQFASQTGRNIYHQVVGYLKKMQGYQGGDLVVKKMVQEFQLKYKNRRAMMEVLNKSFK